MFTAVKTHSNILTISEFHNRKFNHVTTEYGQNQGVRQRQQTHPGGRDRSGTRGKLCLGSNGTGGNETVALCDTWEEKLLEAGKKYGVATYTDYHKFWEHDMDAVVLANYFNEHTPFAIKALAAGKHVMSECACNATLAEGVALCRAVEKSGKTYMPDENYPYTRFNMEMRRLYCTGEIGREHTPKASITIRCHRAN